MAPDKSLAAEIEAVILKHAHTYTIGKSVRFIANADIANAAAEIAALQSRAFEDGAREPEAMRAARRMRLAHQAFDAGRAQAECRDFDLGYNAGVRFALQSVGLWDALPLQPEGERNA